ncbi:MAG: transcriptional repressor [bacterium]|nr:transcriptional repressor [bacterium]
MNNYSKQREIILEIIKKEKSHPTAEDIYVIVHKSYPYISRSTVYRNIGILVNNKTILKLKVQNGADRYDYIYEKHYHSICEKCGIVYDFKYDFDIKRIQKELLKQTDVISNIDTLTIYGICKDCYKEKEDKNGIKRK